MTQQIPFDAEKKRLPVAGGKAELDIDSELQRFEAEERARLGLEEREHWIEDMANLGFTKSQRSHVTLLVGGLTMAHDFLVERERHAYRRDHRQVRVFDRRRVRAVPFRHVRDRIPQGAA
jgi:hypothetical protein